MPPRKSTRKKSTVRRVTRKKSTSTRKKTTSRRRMRGGSVSGVLSGVHDFVKENQLLSKGLKALGQDGISNIAAKVGYGRKKRTSRRKQTGNGLFTDLGTGIHALFGSGSHVKRGGQKGKGLFTDLGTGIHALFGSGMPHGIRSGTKRNALHF